jgi:hypothetical protein
MMTTVAQSSGPGSASALVSTTATVEEVDQSTRMVTLEGPQGGKITLKVQDPANLQRAHVGHLVEAAYREAVSISVQTPTK